MKAHDYYSNVVQRTANWAPPPSDARTRPCSQDDAFMEGLIRKTNLQGGAYLDIGCQAGGLLERLGDCLGERHGVDLADYRRYWEKVIGVQFHVHDIDAGPLPFPDKYFDVVSCFMVLEHVFDVFHLVEEIARVTKPGGQAIVEVPNIAYIKHLLSLIRGTVPQTASKAAFFESTEGWDGQHLHYFTRNELAQVFEKEGFRVLEHATRGKHRLLRKLWPNLLYSSIALRMRKQV